MSYLCPAIADKKFRKMMRYNREKSRREEGRMTAYDNVIQLLITVLRLFQIHDTLAQREQKNNEDLNGFREI